MYGVRARSYENIYVKRAYTNVRNKTKQYYYIFLLLYRKTTTGGGAKRSVCTSDARSIRKCLQYRVLKMFGNGHLTIIWH